MAQARWGFAVVAVVKGKERREGSGRGGLGLLLFSLIPTGYDKGSIFDKISCWAAREGLVDPLGQFA
jgi:hypothetical protein